MNSEQLYKAIMLRPKQTSVLVMNINTGEVWTVITVGTLQNGELLIQCNG